MSPHTKGSLKIMPYGGAPEAPWTVASGGPASSSSLPPSLPSSGKPTRDARNMLTKMAAFLAALFNLLLWISNQICVCVYFQCLVFCWKNKVTDTQPNILNSPSAGDLPSPRGVNPGLPHCRKILYHLSHQGSPNILNNYLHSRHSDNTEQNYLEGQMKSKPGASHHKYETTNAVENLYKKGKILSWVMTGPWNLEKRAKYIRTTWIQPCNRVMFMSSEENKDFLTVGFNTKEGGDQLYWKQLNPLRMFMTIICGVQVSLWKQVTIQKSH